MTALTVLLLVVAAAILVANLMTFPFNELICKRAFKLKFPQGHPWLNDKKRGRALNNMAYMARKTALLLIMTLFLFMATLVPGLGLLAGFLSLMIMAFDRIDYVFDLLGLPFKQRISFIKSSFLEFVGFTIALGLTSFIPVVNILLVPASIVGATNLIAGLLQKDRPVERSYSPPSR